MLHGSSIKTIMPAHLQVRTNGQVWICFLFLLTVYAWTVQPAKILMIPGNINSHVHYFSQLGTGLAAEGHKVSILIPKNAKVPDIFEGNGYITVHLYQTEIQQYSSSKEMSDFVMKQALAEDIWEWIKASFPRGGGPRAEFEKDCGHLVRDRQLMKTVSESDFDFAVMDAMPCFLCIPYAFDIPYGVFAVAFLDIAYRIPKLPSQVSSPLLPYSDQMTFRQRLANFLVDMVTYAIPLLPFKEDYVAQLKPRKQSPNGLELMMNTKLWFALYDPVVGYPRPMMSNAIFMGDIMARPAKPLSTQLDDYISGAKQGAVLVSFGSVMSSLPAKHASILFEALGRLKQVVIMKKAGFVPKIVPSNIKLLEWLPQNDILAHKNVKVFVSHCGQNSLVEAVYHGKPILAIPIFMDQPHNANFVEQKGIGKQLKMLTLTADALQETIEELVHNKSYREAAERLSHVFRDKPETPGASASHMINHVIKHGDAHLRTKSFDLYLFQYLMWDIYLFLLLCLVVAVCISFACIKYSLRILCSCCTAKMLKKETRIT